MDPKLYFLFCPYLRFLDVSWYQMHDGSRQFCRANAIETSL
jgi:hypothetical protein